jgi:ketosteroid isomerase-like protein
MNARALLAVFVAIAAVAALAGSALGAFAGVKSQIRASDEEARFRAVADAWVARYNAGDPAGVAKLYTDDGYYASAHVLAHGRQEIERYWARGIAAGGHLDFVKPVEVHVEGGLGYLLGKYQATNAGVTVDGRILIVGKRRDGTWQIAVHQSVVRDQPE